MQACAPSALAGFDSNQRKAYGTSSRFRITGNDCHGAFSNHFALALVPAPTRRDARAIRDRNQKVARQPAEIPPPAGVM
jgi:hypothetical protein